MISTTSDDDDEEYEGNGRAVVHIGTKFTHMKYMGGNLSKHPLAKWLKNILCDHMFLMLNLDPDSVEIKSIEIGHDPNEEMNVDMTHVEFGNKPIPLF
jgi:hypothetical protein